MAYSIYSSGALVVQSFDTKEADRVYYLITEKFGSVYAKATGVRLQQAKLRNKLDLFSLIEVELVKGREIWRIVGVNMIEERLQLGKIERAILARVGRILRALVPEERDDFMLYELLVGFSKLLHDAKVITRKELYKLESVVLACVLEILGYWNRELLGDLPKVDFDNPKLMMPSDVLHRRLVSNINKALKETSLYFNERVV